MKKTIIILNIAIFSLIVQNLFGQVKSNQQKLLEFSEAKTAEFTQKKAEAEAYARQNNIPMTIETDSTFMELMFIDDFGIPQYYITSNVNSAKTISTAKVHPGAGYGFNLDGSGLTIHEWDAGAVLATHQEFGSRVIQGDGATTQHYHSTHVAGTMIASGVDSDAKGMAPAAELRAFNWNNDGAEMASEAASGALVSNHSYGLVRGWRWMGIGWVWWGSPSISTQEDYHFGFYDFHAKAWDQIAYDAPYYLIVKSAGNDRDDCGNGSHPCDGPYDCLDQYSIAKNILTVGAVHDIPGGYNGPSDVVMSTFSSWGPVDDGRIKPDIVANGISLYSTDDDSDDDYRSLSGTSMASPSAAASLILLQEQYENIHGTGNFMKAATLKALVIHTADEAGSCPGPDYQYGWGLMNTMKAADLILHENGIDTIIKELTLTDGGNYQYSFYNTGTTPLQVTIAWTDPPGTPPSPALDPPDVMLVNDIDLTVTQSANTYYPWKLDRDNPTDMATNTNENNVDNVEVILIKNPLLNTIYNITVNHDGTLDGGSQDYSLIISNVPSVNWPIIPPDTLWTRAVGGTGDDGAQCIKLTDDGGFVVAGYSNSVNGDIPENQGGTDLWVAKFDSDDNISWSRTFGGSRWEQAEAIIVTSDSCYLVAGFSGSFNGDVHDNHGTLDFWIVKLNYFGDTIFTRSYGGSLSEYAVAAIETSDGNFILAGGSQSDDGDVPGNKGSWDFYLVKINPENEIIWTKSFGGSEHEQATSLAPSLDGGCVVAGYTISNDGDVLGNHGKADGWIMKLDSKGDAEWARTLGGTDIDQINSIDRTSDGGYILAGYSFSNDFDVNSNMGSVDYWVVKLNALGDTLWSRSYGGTDRDMAYSVKHTIDGGYLIAGRTESNDGEVNGNYGLIDYWVVKLFANGDMNWSKNFGGSKNDEAFCIDQLEYGDIVIAGKTSSFDNDVNGNHGLKDAWIVKLESDICPIPTDLSSINFTATSAELSWTENSKVSTWEILIDTSGFDTMGIAPTQVTENPIVWENLTPETEYDWYIRAICIKNNYSEWVGPSTFTTSCEDGFVSPFYEDFNNLEVGKIPLCWRSINTNPEDFSIGVSNKEIKFVIGEPFSPLMLITPRLDDLIQQDKQISFYAEFPFIWDNGQPTISVGTISNPAEAETYTEFKEIDLSNVRSEYTIEFDSSYHLSDKYIAFKSGARIWANFSDFDDETFIDDIVYQTIPDNNLSPATLPFIEDFELTGGQRQNSGKMFSETDRRWDYHTSADHQCMFSWGSYSSSSYGGNGAMSFADHGPDVSVNDAILKLNMENYLYSTDITMSCYYQFTTAWYQPQRYDTLYVRGSSNDDWLVLYAFNLDSLDQETFHFIDDLDIDNTLAVASPPQHFTSSFELKFYSNMQYDGAVSVFDLITISGTIPKMDGFFTDSDQLLGTSGYTDVALGDLDGDGDLDAVVTKDGQGEPNKVWLNDGKGIFIDSRMNFGQSKSWAVAIGDLDGDGDLDGFMANDGPNKVYLNDGANTTDNGQSLGAMVSSGVELADLDGDGDLDAVVTNKPVGEPNKLWLNDGNGMFSDAGLRFGYAKTYGIALGDLDDDGDIDGFVANYGANKVYLNTGAPTTDNGQNIGTGYTTDVKLGDADGDGDLDVAVANKFIYQSNYLWLNDGNGYFLHSGIKLGYDISMGIALGDLDLDGDLDAFVANSGPNKVFLNDGANTTDNGQLLGANDSYGIALGDLDDDGDLDAFVANYNGPCKVWINQTLQNTEDDKRDDDVFQSHEVTQSDYSLINYPDPFRHSTTIEFKVPETGYARICVYNSFGKLVKELYDDVADKNKTIKITFNGEFLPSGIYFLNMQHGGTIINEKMVVLK